MSSEAVVVALSLEAVSPEAVVVALALEAVSPEAGGESERPGAAAKEVAEEEAQTAADTAWKTE